MTSNGYGVLVNNRGHVSFEIGSENTEATINSFIDGMAERDIPLAAFHYDCYWMREFHWCDFEWDKRFFGDIESTLKRLHEDKGLHICAWINPYIGQRGEMFKEGRDKGYLVRKPNGEVWPVSYTHLVPLMAQLPLEPEVRETGEAGRPAVLDADGALRTDGIGQTFRGLAERLLAV